jgi:hypothetical protein
MDKLEHYLDQVCRGIGGPRSLRQHIRQELAEHLRDAVAELRTAGLSEEEALARALEQFGGPEDVRSELEAMHGHRLVAVMIDKAMQWKERTLKAKWLWTTWTYIAVVGVVLLEIFYFSFVNVFFVPKLHKIRRDGILSLDPENMPALAWLDSFLHFVRWVGEQATWCLLIFAGLWGLFEWRVRSENKSLMRLSVLGTAAFVLMVGVALLTAAVVIPFEVGLPGINARAPEPVVRDATADVDRAVHALEDSLARKDWPQVQQNAHWASQNMDFLSRMGAAAPALTAMQDQPKVDEMRVQLKSASAALKEAELAGWDKSPERMDAALKKFHKAYGQLVGVSKPER